MSDVRLSVVIVSYNVRYFLEQALQAVMRAAEGLPVEVFVVDNNSQDDSVAMVRRAFPSVQLIANADNPGFSKANNQAIRRAKGEYVLLLNPDTVIAEDTFRVCLDFMDAHPEAGGLGVRMIDGSGAFLPESKRGFPSPWVALSKTVGLSRVFPQSPLFNRYHLGYLPEHEIHAIEVLAGAFMWLRRSVLDDIGLLDESFFMYGEDIDLSYRIVQAGYQNYYLPETTIIHYKGESTKKGSLNYVRVFYQAMIIFARKHFSERKARFFVAMLQVGIYLRALLTVLGNAFRAGLLPLLDAAFILGGLFLLKDFWGGYHFNNPDYYGRTFMLFNAPLYTAFWLVSIYLSGGYDRTATPWRLVRGILVGTLVIAAVYGFLDQSLRSSRALILLGMAWAVAGTIGVRMLRQLMRTGSLWFGLPGAKNLVIVGSEEEAGRAQQLLQRAEVPRRYRGLIAPQPDTRPSATHLGGVDQLPELVRWFRVDEVIFCLRDLPAKTIIYWMDHLGKRLSYKVLPEGSMSIIGSSSRNTAGELYTIDVRYAIATPAHRRNKRLFDLLANGILTVLLPVLFWLQPKPAAFLKNWLAVWWGDKTWVGYDEQDTSLHQLPRLKPGVLSPVRQTTGIDPFTRHRLNAQYARDYRPLNDLRILWRNVRRLG
mgnify:FL=1